MKPLPKMKKAMCIGPSCPGCDSVSCMAKGGEAKPEMHEMKIDLPMDMPHEEHSMNDMDDDSMMDDALGGELLNAFETKNKKEILEAIRAVVLSCKE